MPTIAEQLRAEGEAKGFSEGEAKGHVRALRGTLEKQLQIKFGELEDHHRARIASATPEQLDRFVERVLTADTLEAVLAPLE
jgi:hypothetical protein